MEITISMNISNEPVIILALKIPIKSTIQKNVQMLPVLIIIAASFGGEYLCPIICKTKAIHTEPTEQ